MAQMAGHVPKKKAYAWSYSKLKNFETCPKRHYEIDIAKNYSEEEDTDPTSPLNWGNRVHKELAAACQGAALPAEMAMYQHWVDRVRAGPGKLLVEQKFAINKDFQKTTYFAPDVWYRGIGDIVRIAGPVALVLDWKTGKILVDSIQLMLMAQCIFSAYPEIQKVRSEFVWLKDDCTSPEVFTRREVADEWTGLIQRVRLLEAADATQNYPPKPNKLCRQWCLVTGCIHHGKGFRV